ncbi:hypothetical protein BS78_10G015400, partial [Paspalum vaginatum]
VLPLLLLLLLGSSPTTWATDDEHEFITVSDKSSLKSHAACSVAHRVTVIPPHRGAWAPLYRHLGPCSPSASAPAPAAKTEPSVADLLRRDQLRVDHIHWRLSEDARGSVDRKPVGFEAAHLHDEPVIQVTLGSAKSNSDGGQSSRRGVVQTVVLDTASDVPWVRCAPSCPVPPCHPETADSSSAAFFDPTRSGTYSAVACGSPDCEQLGRLYGDGCGADNQCRYRVQRVFGSFTSSGTYSSDHLTINSASPVPGFLFWCSRAEQGSFERQAGGVMALGRGSQSLTAQTSSTFGDAFSYCLPPSETAKGFFRLGVPGGAADRFVMTPMLRDRREDVGDPTLYRARLVGITVDGRPLNVVPDVFAAGTVLDSRTVITRLPLTAYGALRAAFRDRMAHRAAPPQEELDTCYDLRGVRYPRVPRVALVFDGNAVVELDRSGVLFNSCLAFASNDDDASPSILGNVQQQTIEVLHDVGGRRIGFRRAAC